MTPSSSPSRPTGPTDDHDSVHLFKVGAGVPRPTTSRPVVLSYQNAQPTLATARNSVEGPPTLRPFFQGQPNYNAVGSRRAPLPPGAGGRQASEVCPYWRVCSTLR